MPSFFTRVADLKETEGVQGCFARAYFDMGVRKRVAECTYVLPHTNFLSQLSCHTVKRRGTKQQLCVMSFLSRQSSDFFFLLLLLLETLYFSLSSTSLSLSFSLSLSVSLQGPHAAINFNTWRSNRCSLELCTHTQQAGNKGSPPPSLQPFNLK